MVHLLFGAAGGEERCDLRNTELGWDSVDFDAHFNRAQPSVVVVHQSSSERDILRHADVLCSASRFGSAESKNETFLRVSSDLPLFQLRAPCWSGVAAARARAIGTRFSR